MIQLNPPITINPPPFVPQSGGPLQTVNPITLNEIDYALIDHSKHKTVLARIFPCPKPLVLWQNESYDNIGDYTQAQADQRVSELLGSDIESSLEALFR